MHEQVGRRETAPTQRSRRLRAVAAAGATIAALSLAACGSSSSSSSSAAASGGSGSTGSGATSTAASGATSTSGGATSTSGGSGSSSATLKKGLKVFVIPKNLGNNYFTVADSVKTGGALAALQTLGETGSETSGSAATSASQLPAIQAAISKGANGIVISATDPTALCPTLKQAMARGISVVTYDSDAPTCRNLFINQASSSAIGKSEVDLLAKEIHDKGQIGIVSAAASAPNQNLWIKYMKQELAAKYPNIKLVSTVYGNDDPTTAAQVTSGLLQHYPNLAGIISPTTVGILAAAQVLDTSQYRGKVQLTGLGTPLSMKKFVDDGTVQAFELWNPANLGYLAAYATVALQSKTITGAQGQKFSAGKLGSFTVGADHQVLLGPPQVFNKANISKFHF
jgi:rhamnose transport system substrate-binding protein